MNKDDLEKRESLLSGILQQLNVDDFFDAFSKAKPEEKMKAFLKVIELTGNKNEATAVSQKITFKDGKLIVQTE